MLTQNQRKKPQKVEEFDEDDDPSLYFNATSTETNEPETDTLIEDGVYESGGVGYIDNDDEKINPDGTIENRPPENDNQNTTENNDQESDDELKTVSLVRDEEQNDNTPQQNKKKETISL